jgi:hypothetical protein
MFLLLPLRKLHPETYYWIEGKLFHWLLANVAMWSYMAGYDSEFNAINCRDLRWLIACFNFQWLSSATT